MTTRRARGRPTRAGGDAGRDALIAAARKMLRRRPRAELSRKELAIEAGVTSALVAYYFKDQSSLIESAVKPIIDDYLDRLRSLVAQDVSIERQFRSLIIFLLQVARNDGLLLEKFISYAKYKRQANSVSQFLRVAQIELAALLHRCQEENYLRQYDLAILQTVIWGTCRSIALTPELNTYVRDLPSGGVRVEEWEADIIVDLLVHGVGGSARAFNVP